MKVFYDSQIFLVQDYGGVSRYFVELASRLGGYPNINARVVAPFFQSRFLSEQKHAISTIGLDLASVPKLPARLLRPVNAILFRGYATVCSPDIVHETLYAPYRAAPHSAKIVTTIHDTIPERLPYLWRTIAQHRTERQKILARADQVICVSESTRSDLLDLYGVDPSRVSVVLLAASILPSSEGPIDIGSPYFLHVGARHHYKNFNGLVKAFGGARLYRTHKLVSFTSAPFTPDEVSVMRRAGVPPESVVRVGGDDNLLSRYYAGAEAFVYPSLYEGFGIPLLEAMRCRCPVVTSNLSSMPEVAGDAAIYVDATDVGSISDALLEIISSRDERTRLIKNGFARAQMFSWDRCASETLAVYQRALNY